jgi:hypothetical protein
MPESPSRRMLACRSRPLTRQTSGRRCLGADAHRPLTEHTHKERNPGDSNLANWEAKHLLARNLCSLSANSGQTFLNIFFGVPHLAPFIFDFSFLNVLACIIAYIHPVYCAGVRAHDLLVMSRLP